MKVVSRGVEIISEQNGKEIMERIEKCGRVCYQSFDRISEGSSENLVRMLIKSGHHSVLEHAGLTMMFTMERSLTHELVRHRIASFSEMSQRYVGFSKDRFGAEVKFIKPSNIKTLNDSYDTWHAACEDSEEYYMKLIEIGEKPEEARSVLNNSVASQIAVTANLREWRHIFNLRCDGPAHPDIRLIMKDALAEAYGILPVVFEDLATKYLK